MIDYRVEVRGVSEQIRKLENYDAIARREEVPAMDRSVRLIVGDARSNAPRGPSGNLASSGEADVRPITGYVVGKVEFTDYKALWAEFGTDPHWPPPEKLAQSMGVEIWEAHLIARKIAVSGTPASHFLWRAYKDNAGTVRRLFEIAVDRITRALVV